MAGGAGLAATATDISPSRHHEDDAKAFRLEVVQEFGQRQRGRELDVVQQHDARIVHEIGGLASPLTISSSGTVVAR